MPAEPVSTFYVFLALAVETLPLGQLLRATESRFNENVESNCPTPKAARKGASVTRKTCEGSAEEALRL